MAMAWSMDEQTSHKVLKQVEFYFGDDNLQNDEWLRETLWENGTITISLLCTLSPMRVLLGLEDGISQETIQAVAETLRKSASLKISQDGRHVGRLIPLRNFDQERLDLEKERSDARTVAVSPLERPMKLQKLKSLFSQYAKVNSVSMPRDVDGNVIFCGTVLVEFSTEEDAERILNETISFAGTDLKLKPKKKFVTERAMQEEDNSMFEQNHAKDSIVAFKLKRLAEDLMEVVDNKPENDIAHRARGSIEETGVQMSVDEDMEEIQTDKTEVLESEAVHDDANFQDDQTPSQDKSQDVVSPDDLKSVFQQFGTVKSVEFVIGSESGYIEFEDAGTSHKARAAANLADEGGVVVKNYVAILNPVTADVNAISDEEFMEKLLSLNDKNLFYNIDTLELFGFLRRERTDRDTCRIKDLIERHAIQCAPAPLEGRDLESMGVYHYQFSELSQFIRDKRPIASFMNGKFYKCQFTSDDGPITRTMKVWNVYYPADNTNSFFHPARLYNDIYLLNKKLKPRSYLPRVVGYSIDKILAVVYDFDPKYSLDGALVADELSWEERLSTALGVARAFQLFHDNNIKVGRIDSEHVIYDQDMNLYYCDFCLCPEVKDKIIDDRPTRGRLGRLDGQPDRDVLECSLETDIYCFGVLLLELISKVKVKFREYDKLPEGTREKFQACNSLLHESFNYVSNAIGYQISKLVMDCTEVDMDKRLKIASVIATLERLIPPTQRLSKKPKLELKV